MEEFLEKLLNRDQNVVVLLVVVGLALAALGYLADRLVNAAVALSLQTGLPKVVIGVTIVSLGTTFPEAAVSVLAAWDGESELALGNAVGSIICDTGLILGIAATIRALPLDRSIVPRQAWVQLAAGSLLILSAWPLLRPLSAFRDGGSLPQSLGIFFLVLLGVYMWISVRWSRQHRRNILAEEPFSEEIEGEEKKPTWTLIAKLILCLAGVVLSSKVLIPAVRALAEKGNVPDSVVSATLVAFGTSLPELVTAVTATLKGHGELAIGNVIGADILNVLFVAGAAAAITPAGLYADAHFFYFYFPVMLAVLVFLRIGIGVGKTKLGRPFGVALVTVYVIYLVVNVVLFRPVAH